MSDIIAFMSLIVGYMLLLVGFSYSCAYFYLWVVGDRNE